MFSMTTRLEKERMSIPIVEQVVPQTKLQGKAVYIVS
jgi:hypothetical protein